MPGGVLDSRMQPAVVGSVPGVRACCGDAAQLRLCVGQGGESGAEI